MELEQLVGMVRHERAKLAAYEALDEILTVVLEAKDRVAAYEKQVITIEAKLKEAQKKITAVDATIQEKQEKLQQHLVERQALADKQFAESKAKIDADTLKYTSAREAARQEMEHNIAAATKQRKVLQAIDVRIEEAKLELSVAETKLADFKASLL